MAKFTWPLVAIGAVIDGIELYRAYEDGDGFGMYVNGAQIYGGIAFIGGSAAVIAAGVAASPLLVAAVATLGVTLAVSALVEASGVHDAVANRINKRRTTRANRDGTCATLKQSFTFYSAKTCKSADDEQRLTNIRSAWESNDCPGSLE